jgi:hypothetical protein
VARARDAGLDDRGIEALVREVLHDDGRAAIA